ncbi:MAG: hypothetical protein JO345_38545 [Streptosporangiaceae bacterium]|nr:hypothetical protein [Streptosporangiaceae bacterium]
MIWKRLGWSAAVAAVAAGLFTAYLEQSARGTYVNADGASNALQAWDMLHGNLLLHGWALADVSFYTTDLPQYMAVEAIRGLGPDVVHICAALAYTVLVLLAAWLAKGRATGGEGATRALIAAGIMLAPQLGGGGTGILLLSPDHVATAIPLLLAWLIIDRGRGWPVPVSVGLLLTWTIAGDPLAAVVGALPLAAVCAMRLLERVVLRRDKIADNSKRRRGGAWYHLSLLGAAMVSVPAAWGVTKLIAASGGWTQTAVQTGLAGSGMLGQHAALTGTGILQLFGAGFRGQPGGVLTAFAFVHLIGVALAAWGFLLAVRHFFAADLLVQVLTTAIVVNLAAYMFSVQAQDITRTREIAAVLPFGAVLAGRLVACNLRGPRLGPLMAGILAVYAGMLVFDAVQPPVPAPTAALATWLARHDLTRGLAGYWQANSVTLYSRGQVQVRAIGLNSRGQLSARSWWQARQAWYDPATEDASFVISVPPPARWQDQALIREMEAQAGRPVHVYQVGAYSVAVWNVNLLARLGPVG